MKFDPSHPPAVDAAAIKEIVGGIAALWTYVQDTTASLPWPAKLALYTVAVLGTLIIILQLVQTLCKTFNATDKAARASLKIIGGYIRGAFEGFRYLSRCIAWSVRLVGTLWARLLDLKWKSWPFLAFLFPNPRLDG